MAEHRLGTDRVAAGQQLRAGQRVVEEVRLDLRMQQAAAWRSVSSFSVCGLLRRWPARRGGASPMRRVIARTMASAFS
jgi:hypothetical protein